MTHDKEDGHGEDAQRGIAKDLEELDAGIDAILERLGGPLTKEQRESLKNLMRLDHVLSGPDTKLDSELYSRAVPPLGRIKPQ